MKKLSSYIIIFTILTGVFGLNTKTISAVDPLGTCKFYSGVAVVSFERTTKAVCDLRKLVVPWKESTLAQYNAEVAKYNALGTCITKSSDGRVTKREKTIETACDRPIGGDTKRWIPDNRENMLGICEDHNRKVINGNTTKKICEDLLRGNWRLFAKDATDLGEEYRPPTGGGNTPPKEEETKKDPTYIFLAPLPCDDTKNIPGCVGGELTTFDPTNAQGENSKIGEYLNIMIRIFIGICAVLAVIMIVMGGIEYMTSELISNKENGKHHITGAIFGLLLALGAWTILNQINPDILNTDLSSLKTVEVEVTLDDSVPQTYDQTTKKYKNGITHGADWLSIAGAQTTLPTGVTVNKAECAVVGNQNCTSIRGLRLDYINTILEKCKDCKSLMITGGTEFWLHGGQSGNTNHKPNSPAVDLRITPELTQYITEGKKLEKKRYSKDGISYLYEGSHWHVGP